MEEIRRDSGINPRKNCGINMVPFGLVIFCGGGGFISVGGRDNVIKAWKDFAMTLNNSAQVEYNPFSISRLMGRYVLMLLTA